MGHLFLPLFIAAIVVVAYAVRRTRRRADATPQLHEHPERLDQMLDPTDDA